MLIYHPMFDPHHCAFRLSCILLDCDRQALEWERIRLLDFFVTFPHLLKTMRLPQEFRSEKKVLKAVADPYESLPSPARLFFQLSEIQMSAVRMLVAGGFINRNKLVEGFVTLAPSHTSHKLEALSQSAAFRSSAWYAFITKKLSKYPLHGKDGLKERSGLMEFRHDPV